MDILFYIFLSYFSVLSMGKPSGHSDMSFFRTKKTESIVVCSIKKGAKVQLSWGKEFPYWYIVW